MLLKIYVFERGFYVDKDFIRYNTPVTFRSTREAKPSQYDIEASRCHQNMSIVEMKEFLMWEVSHCTVSKNVKNSSYTQFIYAPAVKDRVTNGFHCLRPLSSSLYARIRVDSSSYPGPPNSYLHPLDYICRYFEDSEGCDIKSARTEGGRTIVTFKSHDKRAVLDLAGGHRPGITALRTLAEFMKMNSSSEKLLRHVVGVELAMRASSCYVTDSVVRNGLKVGHVRINLVLIALWICMEVLMRRIEQPWNPEDADTKDPITRTAEALKILADLSCYSLQDIIVC